MIQQPYNSLHSIIYERLSLSSSHVLFLTGKPALPVTNTFKMSNSRYKMRLKEFMMQNYLQNFRGRVALGSHREAIQPDALKAGLAEFISVLIFVFAGEGSGMAFNRITENGAQTPAGLILAALAHGFGLFVAVSAAANISGGHCNPAVTFGAFLGGNITLFRGLLYWIAQLLGSVAACFLLKFVTHGMSTPVFVVSADVSVWNALVFEIVMTFGLVYTVYATAIDPNKGTVGTIAPIAIGFIVAANILAGGAFEGASMNPAVSFGPAVASLNFHNLWVYIAGPLIGGGFAGLIYEFIFIDRSHRTHEPLPTVADY